MNICVIGAGFIGTTTAWYQSRMGARCILVDPNEVGAGASLGNGRQLSYDFVAPLADSKVLRAIPSLLLSESSPLRFRWRSDPDLWRWVFSFLRACNQQQFETTTRRLLQLALHSQALAHSLLQDATIQADHRVPEKLVVSQYGAQLFIDFPGEFNWAFHL